MEKEKLTAGARIMVGEVMLVPVVRTFIHCQNSRRGVAGFGTKEFVGVVVVSPAGRRALSASGEEIPVEEYVRQVPEIEELLRSG